MLNISCHDSQKLAEKELKKMKIERHYAIEEFRLDRHMD
jgi:hypothetical protein